MSEPITLAIDAMGGDHGCAVTIAASREVLSEARDLRLILVGDKDQIRKELARKRSAVDQRIEVRHASEVVEMDESPSKALRNKKDSSMRIALNLVKEERAAACVSAGNTGALMATARFVLKMLPGVDRPAIISSIPSVDGHTHMLDLGANAQCSSEQLFQFAVMGAALATAEDGLEHPRIGLLNIGEEEIKGNEVIKQAAMLLSESKLNYIGFVEGDGIFFNQADVVVCDGFAGNVALKTGEGVARLIYQFMKEEFTSNLWHRMAALAAYPALKSIGRRIDPRRYNGASLLGLNGIVIKSHGGADAAAFATAIRVAVLEVQKNVPERIAAMLASALIPVVPVEPQAASS